MWKLLNWIQHSYGIRAVYLLKLLLKKSKENAKCWQRKFPKWRKWYLLERPSIRNIFSDERLAYRRVWDYSQQIIEVRFVEKVFSILLELIEDIFRRGKLRSDTLHIRFRPMLVPTSFTCSFNLIWNFKHTHTVLCIRIEYDHKYFIYFRIAIPLCRVLNISMPLSHLLALTFVFSIKSWIMYEILYAIWDEFSYFRDKSYYLLMWSKQSKYERKSIERENWTWTVYACDYITDFGHW